MKTLKSKITIVLSLLFLFATVDLQAQINLNKLGNQLKKSAEQQIEHKVKEKTARETRETLENAEKKLDRAVSDATSGGSGAKEATGGQIPKGTKDIYVSVAKGSNRNDGSQSSPYKDIQKAVDAAPDGAVIHVAEGNYLGNLNRGFIEIKKYISIVGGYSDDFASRDFNPKPYTI